MSNPQTWPLVAKRKLANRNLDTADVDGQNTHTYRCEGKKKYPPF